MVETSTMEQNKEKRMKRNENTLRDHRDVIKWNIIQIIGVLEEEEKEKGSEKIFEKIKIKNFPNMEKEKKKKKKTQVQDKP